MYPNSGNTQWAEDAWKYQSTLPLVGSWKMLKAASPKLLRLIGMTRYFPTRSLRLEVKHQNNPQPLPNLHDHGPRAWWNLFLTFYSLQKFGLPSSWHPRIPENLRHQVVESSLQQWTMRGFRHSVPSIVASSTGPRSSQSHCLLVRILNIGCMVDRAQWKGNSQGKPHSTHTTLLTFLTSH